MGTGSFWPFGDSSIKRCFFYIINLKTHISMSGRPILHICCKNHINIRTIYICKNQKRKKRSWNLRLSCARTLFSNWLRPVQSDCIASVEISKYILFALIFTFFFAQRFDNGFECIKRAYNPLNRKHGLEMAERNAKRQPTYIATKID